MKGIKFNLAPESEGQKLKGIKPITINLKGIEPEFWHLR